MSLTAALRDLNKLNTFVRVGERLSFTKAAADLRTTPSVVSKHMKELEAALGFSLLNRSTHGIVLTEAGEGLFQSCLQMLSKLDGYVVEARNLQKGPVGTLRVQAASDYARCVLAPVMAQFVERHPGLRIHLSAATDGSASADDGFDVIVATTKPALPGLVDRDLGGIAHVVCASPAYFQRFGRPKKPRGSSRAQLPREPVVHAERLAVQGGLAASPGWREGRAVLEQPRRSDPDGCRRSWDHPGAALRGQSRAREQDAAKRSSKGRRCRRNACAPISRRRSICRPRQRTSCSSCAPRSPGDSASGSATPTSARRPRGPSAIPPPLR